MKGFTRLGILTACLVMVFAFYGARSAYSDLSGAVSVFDISQVWQTWNTVLTVLQIATLIFCVWWYIRFSTGKRYVLVEPETEQDETVSVWEEDGTGWDVKRSISKKELPSESEVLAELKGYGNMRPVHFWAAKLKTPRVKKYKKCKNYCLTQRKKAKARADKLLSQMNTDTPSPTIEFK